MSSTEAARGRRRRHGVLLLVLSCRLRSRAPPPQQQQKPASQPKSSRRRPRFALRETESNRRVLLFSPLLLPCPEDSTATAAALQQSEDTKICSSEGPKPIRSFNSIKLTC